MRVAVKEFSNFGLSLGLIFVNAEHLPDNLHPNAAGYDILSKVITDWMESLVLTDD